MYDRDIGIIRSELSLCGPKDSFIEVARFEECKPLATNSPFREKWE